MEREQQIITLIDQYATSTGLSPASIGIYTVGNSRIASSLDRGGFIRPATYVKVISYLSDHWPDDLPWPDDIPRPEPTSEVAG